MTSSKRGFLRSFSQEVGTHSWVQIFALSVGAVYLFILPFGHVAALRNISFFIALGLAIYIWHRSQNKHLPLLWLFVAWFGIASLSLLWSIDTASTIDAIVREVIKSSATFFLFFIITREGPALRVWVIATSASLILITLVAAVRFPIEGPWSKGFLPPRGDFATMGLTILPLLVGFVALRFKENPIVSTIAGIAILGTLYSGFLTHSRAFWLGLLSVNATWVVCWVVRVKRLGGLFVMGIVFSTIVFGILAVLGARDRNQDLLNFDDRAQIYATVIEKLLTHPLIGTGFGHETNKEWYKIEFGGWDVFHAHNIVLSYFEQLGVIGLALLALIFLCIGRYFTRAISSASIRVVIFGAMGLATLVSVLIKNSLDMFFVGQSLWLFFALTGIYLGILVKQGISTSSMSKDWLV